MKKTPGVSVEPARPAPVDEARESGGVIAVARALRLLEAFQVDDAFVSLAELSRRTGMHKTTTLRIARTLAEARYLVQRDEDGAWRLGPAAGWLGARYQASFDLNNEIEPTLRELTRETGESASFFVREGDMRTCLVRVEGPKAIRHHIRMGEVLPLEKGSPGRVLLAFSGEPGEPYETIRREGFYISIGEREAEIASVSAPVFGANWRLLGALSVSGPGGRLPGPKLRSFAKLIKQKASHLSYVLSGGAQRQAPTRSQWHP
ncbi:MAG: IclR family transcriptional regulator [Achromobacter sp.]